MSAVRYFGRLRSLREQLEARLLLHEERHCFGEGDIDDGTTRDLKERISELSRQMSRRN
ncbi:MAG: hypothetical protein KGI75_03895 [Rhizobiaceae bacterium]|nr:hypothetical protein [Rhizobiaceae bacterium]